MSGFDRKESPLFVKTADFIVWLFQHSAKFPRQYRHTLTERLEASALRFQRCLGECLIQKRPQALAEADLELWQVRQLLRLAHDLNLFSARLLEHAFNSLVELGRLLGAWRAKAAGT
jgi:hypothetical protein